MPFFSPESSHHQRYEVPLPVSLTLYNLHVPLSNIATTHESSSSKTTLFRPEYTSDLLPPVRLDIIFSGNSNNNNNNNNIQEEQDTDIVLYSSQNDNHPSIHPCWNHLEERIEALHQDDSIYTHLKCMLLLVSLQHSEPSVLVATVPLHPSKLRRLPPPPCDHQQQQQEAWQQQQPPPPTRLPPNAILIHFSDGSTRVCPPLYHLLLQQDVIREVNLQDSSLLQDDVEEYKQASRFDDDVFLTLDDDFHQTKMTTTSTVKQQRTTSPLSLLETDDESQAVPVQVTSLHSGSDDIDGSDDDGLENDERMRNAEKMAKLSLMDETTKLPSQVDIRIIDLQRKKQELELLIAQEEACLQEELAELRENEECLKALMERVSKVESETILIQTDANETRIKKGELHFCLEAQRIKLLDELRMIYPIRCQAEETWFIRGQEIPHDLFSGGVSEEEISAALGFLCHSVVMISKYLAIALRYRIVCNSSRSAIQQDATTILPLFQARVVERDELQRAMALIERNVACILKTRGIHYLEDSHILCKVNRIYAQIVDGQR